MRLLNRFLILAAVLVGLFGLAGCGGGDDEAESTAGAESSTEDAGSSEELDSEEGDDESHEDDETHEDDESHGDDDDDDHAGGMGAHEHGAATMSVAWSGGDVLIDLISPAYNIYGFEYEPESDDEIAVADDADDLLASSGMVVLNSEAGCSPVGDTDVDFEVDGSHAEVTASWLLACENPDEIGTLDASALFDAFPDLEDIDVEWASDAGQSAGELTADNSILELG